MKKILDFFSAKRTMQILAVLQLSFMEASKKAVYQVLAKAEFWQQVLMGVQRGFGKYGIPTSENEVAGRPHTCAPRKGCPVRCCSKGAPKAKRETSSTKWEKSNVGSLPSPFQNTGGPLALEMEQKKKNVRVWIRCELENWKTEKWAELE